jgi:glycosyltransferase involved in cell wall biosynthesis
MAVPLYSVIIPLYNKSKYIERAINSVLKQTFDDFEVIVVDDGSTDDGPGKVEAFVDSRIVLVRQENSGVSSARNRGIKEARGQYIAFLDSDDEWRENKLEKHFNFHELHPDCLWSVSCFTRRYHNRDLAVKFAVTRVFPDALVAIAESMPIWTGAVVVQKDCFDPDCLFSVGVPRSEDREVWIKLACLYPKIGYINHSLAIYHVGIPGSLVNIGIKDKDLSFLSLAKRLDPFIVRLSELRFNALNRYLKTFNRKACLSIWASNRETLQFVRMQDVRCNFTGYEHLILEKMASCSPLLKRVCLRLARMARII